MGSNADGRQVAAVAAPGPAMAGRPTGTVEVPAAVADLIGSAAATPVWRNNAGGLTWEIADADGRRFLKWAPLSGGLDLTAEVSRLGWARPYTTVPEPIAHGADGTGQWLLTRALPGENAVAAKFVAEPAAAVDAIGTGLRRLHDALPVGRCPFDWSAAGRLRAVDVGPPDPARWHPDHRRLTVDRALALVADTPSVDRLVVCHGDACAPNTLVGPAGEFVGHVDLGSLGVADRWADLAVAAWSTEWNYGPGWSPRLLDAYGVAPDPDRMAYYRLLWDLT